jgi:hypothetical protein
MNLPRTLSGLAFAVRCALLAGVLLVGVTAALTLVREPCVGVADNLDYWRVARPAGIDVPRQRKPGFFVVCSYATTGSDLGSLISSPAVVARLARSLGWGLQVPAGRFDLRQLGLLYGAVAAAVLAAALLLGLPALEALLFAWVLADPGFLLFFNSLYADPAMLIGLLATACFLPLAGRARGAWPPVLLLAAATLTGFSKMQYSFFPALLLVAMAAALAFRRERPGRRGLAFLAALALIAAAPALFLWGPAPRFLNANAYDAIFGGIAKVASDPQAALAALGVPAEYRDRPTKSYFAAKVDRDDPVLPVLRQLSRLRLAALYVRDPEAMARAATKVARELWTVDTNPRGNYVHEESGTQPRGYETPWQFSLWRARALGWLPPEAVWVLLAAVLAALAARGARRRWNAEDTLCLFFVLWVMGQAVVAVLGDGFVSLQQHLVGARFGLDLLLVVVVARTLAALVRGFRQRAGAEEMVGAAALQRRGGQVEQEGDAPGLDGQDSQGGDREQGGRRDAEQAREAFDPELCGRLRHAPDARQRRPLNLQTSAKIL